MSEDRLRFPNGFLWGTATSAYQVEGENPNGTWWAWESVPGQIYQDGHSYPGCDWWRGRAEDDFEHAAAMHNNALRLSVDWSRIEPNEGSLDEMAITRYRQMLTALRERGIEPMVTLHHFNDPLWLAVQGGWENPATPKKFARFAATVVEALGDLVQWWCTINEPIVFAYQGFVAGRYAPGRKGLRRALRVTAHLLRGHALAYRAIHRLQGNAQVGLTHYIRPFEPARPNSAFDRAAARTLDRMLVQSFLYGALDGRLRLPFGLTRRIPEAIDTQDYIGVDYYSRDLVTFDPTKLRELFAHRHYAPDDELSDAGTEGPYGAIYPDGLYHSLMRLASLGKPIIVTENGLPDHDDDQRPRFLLTHLAAVHRALSQGADVRGYFHWTLVDNFEWTEGWGLRFGLIALDPETGKRTPRPSSRLYGQICLANAVTREIVEDYAPEAMGDVFPGL